MVHGFIFPCPRRGGRDNQCIRSHTNLSVLLMLLKYDRSSKDRKWYQCDNVFDVDVRWCRCCMMLPKTWQAPWANNRPHATHHQQQKTQHSYHSSSFIRENGKDLWCTVLKFTNEGYKNGTCYKTNRCLTGIFLTSHCFWSWKPNHDNPEQVQH